MSPIIEPSQTELTDRTGEGAPRSRARRIVTEVAGLPWRYRVTVAVLVAPAVATALARAGLGSHPETGAILDLGYGWPTTLEAGRPWTLVTGTFVTKSFVISVAPTFSAIGVALLEHRARHWRTAAIFLGGQFAGVLAALLLSAPLRGGDSAFARELTETVDFGFSVGGFAALGAWSTFLRPSLRRPVQVGISCYLAAMLLVAGLIYDVSHPIGWALGVAAGGRLTRPTLAAGAAGPGGRAVGWIAFGAVVGAAIGVHEAWGAGGIGGPFGWGPGA